MNYKELNKTTPYNYYPTGDSAKFDLPEDKVTKFRRLWRKYHPKKKTKQQDNDITCQEPLSVPTPNDDNLIMVGGLVGESQIDRYKNLVEISYQIWNGSTPLSESESSFYIFRKDTNTVLRTGVKGYENAKSLSNQIRKRYGLKWDQVSFKKEMTPKTAGSSSNRPRGSFSTFTNPSGQTRQIYGYRTHRGHWKDWDE